ncbi:MAG: reverse transcriptase/maturase family protein [Salinisphaera sp.]|nr:reverse transcriptase/maturase family protein [Salinisphaera sp.]
MKTYNNLFPQIYDFEALHNAYLRARRGKRHRHEVLRFEQDLEGELIQLQNELIWGEYQTGPYRRFYVYEPKKRLAAALPFRDRVVQHSLVAAIEPIWEARFIHHSYACRPGRGMHAGANQAQQWLREVRAQYGRVYVLKADVSQYFASIDHEVMTGLLRRRMACRPTVALCEAIIDTWAPGLPIGNLTSQLWANVYLHELDGFIKQTLRVRRYGRYMDDFVLIHHDKAQLHAWRREITGWVRAVLRLELNQKTQIFPVARCRGRALDFLGYRMWPTHRRLRRDSVKRMQRRLRIMQQDYADGRIVLGDIRKRMASWIGHAKHADTYRLRRKLLGGTRFQRHAAPAAGDEK